MWKPMRKRLEGKLTKAGKKQLQVKKEEWEEYSQAVGRVLGGVCYG